MNKADEDMAAEYDFSGAERGKFYRAGADLVPPVHLETEVLRVLMARASARGTSLSAVVNGMLKKDLAASEAKS